MNWDKINIEQLGVSAITVGILLVCVWKLWEELKAERRYSQSLVTEITQLTGKVVDFTGKLEAVLSFLASGNGPKNGA